MLTPFASKSSPAGRLLALPLAVLAALPFAQGAIAQSTFPARPITLIAPFPPAGAADVISRLVADPLGEILGQPIVVENRAGGGGRIGTDAAVRAEPDGYTLLMASQATHSINPELYDDLGYDPSVDLVPVAVVGAVGSVLYVGNDVPVETMQELIEAANSDPEAMTYGSAGYGGGSHLCMELLETMIEGGFTHVPFQGTAPATTAVLGGEVDMLCDPITTGLQQVRSGAVRALAVTTAERHPELPDVPTVAESGLPEYEAVSYYGLYAPAGVPENTLRTLREAVTEAIEDEDVWPRLESLGMVRLNLNADGFGEYVAADRARWGEVIRDAGITAN